MAEFREYHKNRVIFDMALTSVEDYEERVILCVPKFAWEVARTMLRGYGMRKTNYSIGYSASSYQLPTPEIYDNIEASVSLFLGAYDMSCDLSEMLERLADALENISTNSDSDGCCGGTSGLQGSFGAGSTPSDLGDFVDDGTSFPDDFPDRAAYDAYKCDVANAIIASLKGNADWLFTADLVSLTATALVASFLTPIWGDEILVMVGLLVAFFLQGVLAGSAEELSTYLDDEASDLVCLLSNAETASAAMQQLQNNFADGMGLTAATIGNAMVNADLVNALFENNPLWANNGLTMGVDCSACPDCDDWALYEGEHLGDGVYTSVLSGNGFWYAGVMFSSADTDCANSCGPERSFKISLSGYTAGAAGSDSFRIWSDLACPITGGNADVYSSDAVPDSQTNFCGKAIAVFSATEFTLAIDSNGDC